MRLNPFRYTVVIVCLVAGGTFALTLVAAAVADIYQFGSAGRTGVFAVAAIVTGALVSWSLAGLSPVVKELLVTYRTLSRLESLSNPLLVRLSTEAPGTYHHSLQVGSLANEAARSIGADQLLARLGGYYHDIGKLADPLAFIENQHTDNPLNQLAPTAAAERIIEHIDDGLALARAAHLPAALVAFVPQHTGTTIVRYFYELARQESRRPVNEDRFRYPGPKPLSREAGIVMLADTIEAKARLLREPSVKTISQLVDDAFADKLRDGQLDLAGFQPTDLPTLRRTFIQSLTTMLHRRIPYPTPSDAEYNEGGL
jgi:putative nucleotidyltransferase with HDIG domain